MEATTSKIPAYPEQLLLKTKNRLNTAHAALRSKGSLKVEELLKEFPDREFYFEQGTPLEFLRSFILQNGHIFTLDRRSDKVKNRRNEYRDKLFEVVAKLIERVEVETAEFLEWLPTSDDSTDPLELNCYEDEEPGYKAKVLLHRHREIFVERGRIGLHEDTLANSPALFDSTLFPELQPDQAGKQIVRDHSQLYRLRAQIIDGSFTFLKAIILEPPFAGSKISIMPHHLENEERRMCDMYPIGSLTEITCITTHNAACQFLATKVEPICSARKNNVFCLPPQQASKRRVAVYGDKAPWFSRYWMVKGALPNACILSQLTDQQEAERTERCRIALITSLLPRVERPLAEMAAMTMLTLVPNTEPPFPSVPQHRPLELFDKHDYLVYFIQHHPHLWQIYEKEDDLELNQQGIDMVRAYGPRQRARFLELLRIVSEADPNRGVKFEEVVNKFHAAYPHTLESQIQGWLHTMGTIVTKRWDSEENQWNYRTNGYVKIGYFFLK
ncbi:unnamed protein product, partial [Mesorhabditis spiculigera]